MKTKISHSFTDFYLIEAKKKDHFPFLWGGRFWQYSLTGACGFPSRDSALEYIQINKDFAPFADAVKGFTITPRSYKEVCEEETR